MANELEITQAEMNNELDESINNATAIITKNYLDKLETLDIIAPSAEDVDIDIVECGKFYKLSKLVVNKEENFLNKLTTIVNVASSIDCSITTVIKSDGMKIDYYFGILSKNVRDYKEISVKRRKANATAFKGALDGNLVGSDLTELSNDEVQLFKDRIFKGENKCYSSVSGIVGLRDEEDKSIEGYVQGIENLVDSLKGQKYTIVMIADPLSSSEIQTIKRGYELMHTELSRFARSSVTINENDTLSLSKARTQGISEGISKGISLTQSKTKSKGKSFGGSISAGVSFIASANLGFNFGRNSSVADTIGRNTSTTESSQRNKSVTDTSSSSKTEGRSLQLNYENRSVKMLLDKIDKHLERLDECESFGAFDCATYVIAGNREIALNVASNYNALMRGKDSNVQSSHINLWYKPEDTQILAKYIGSLVHPRFIQNKEAKIIVTPASIVSGNELAIQIGLPKKSVAGITVIPMAPFGRNILDNKNDTLVLGKLYHMGHNEECRGKKQEVCIDIESLSMHTFITGSTGKGKSTAIYSILDKLLTHNVKGKDEKIKFMVIEPAKGEYKNRFGNYDNVHVYGTNYKKMPLLKINPFSFPDDIHVLEHIDRLIEIFNVCWPMYAAMPAVLKDSIERAYFVSGWNLETSECRYQDTKGNPLYPSFIDVLHQINKVMDDSAYSADSKGDYKGALCTRLKSLTNGLYSQIFTNDELSGKELFDENVIIDLSRTGSSETKSLIMGLLVMKLQEYRMANAGNGNAPLKHVTVLEEAHNILKRTSTEQSSESSNMLGKSVEMLANSIAEMRTYGEGFIIADQAPGLMDMSVIRNTNTKIILGLPDLQDRQLVGRAAGLNDDQIIELSRLKTFVAAVYQNNWLEPVLCNIDTNFKDTLLYSYVNDKTKNNAIYNYIDFILDTRSQQEKMDRKYIDTLKDGIYKINISSESRIAFIKLIEEKNDDIRIKYMGQILWDIFNTESALRMVEEKTDNIENWYQLIKEVLEPRLIDFTEEQQKEIVTLILLQKLERDGSQESKELLDRFVWNM